MKKIDIDFPALLTATCALVIVIYYSLILSGTVNPRLLWLIIVPITYIVSTRIFNNLRERGIDPAQLLRSCWCKLWPVCIILFFLVPSWGQIVQRSFEIRNFAVGQEDQVSEQKIYVYGIYYNGNRVLSARQILNHSEKKGNWKLQGNRITGQGASILQWHGKLPYSAMGVLSLRLGFGPESGAAQIVRDGKPLTVSLHHSKSGGNLTYQFSNKIISYYFLIDCLFRIIIALVICQLVITVVILASIFSSETSEIQLQYINRVNIFLVFWLFLLTLAACWPADMKGDSMFSYCWARDDTLRDGRSIPYMLLWQVVFLLTYQPWPMLLLHLSLYWGGWYIFAETIRPKIGYFSVIPIIVGALPWTVGLAGTLLEHMLIANILLITTVLFVRTFQNLRLTYKRFLLFVGLLFFAYCIRDKIDGLYVFPFLYLCVEKFSTIAIWKNRLTHKICISIIIFMIFMFSANMLKTLVNAEKLHKEKVLLSHFHALAVNEYGQVNKNEDFNIYFNQRASWRIGQSYYSEYFNNLQQSSGKAIYHLITTIRKNFDNFVQNYYINLKNNLLINRNLGTIRWDRYPTAKHVNCYNLKKPETILSKSFTRYVNANRNLILFKPWFILLSTIIVLGYLFKLKRSNILFDEDYKILLAVNISAIIALMLYIPQSFLSFYRYYYWASLANWFCITYLFIGLAYNLTNTVKNTKFSE